MPPPVWVRFTLVPEWLRRLLIKTHPHAFILCPGGGLAVSRCSHILTSSSSSFGAPLSNCCCLHQHTLLLMASIIVIRPPPAQLLPIHSTESMIMQSDYTVVPMHPIYPIYLTLIDGHSLLLSNYRSPACDCGGPGNNLTGTTASLATTMNPAVGASRTATAGGPGQQQPPQMMMAGGGCACAGFYNISGPSMGSQSTNIGSNLNQGAAAADDGTTTSNAETLLSSNARFQAISAIAVSQDGVINVADRGKLSRDGFEMEFNWEGIGNNSEKDAGKREVSLFRLLNHWVGP